MSAGRRISSVVARTLRAPVRLASAAAASGGLYVGVKLERRLLQIGEARSEAYVRAWARSILRSFGVEVVVDPPGHKPVELLERAARLVVANHRSMVDILLMLDLFGGHLLARGDMAGWPFIGEMAKTAGTLFVDRQDPSSGAGAVQRIRDHLKQGKTIGLFPEGTTFPDDEVRPFHGGAFIALSRAQGEVLPVGIAYADPSSHYGTESFTEHAKRLLAADRTRVAVAVGPPIPAKGLTSSALRDRSHAEVQALVHRARRLL
jgi:1-acyl-sn-glycerol-3-phosphate acyltransferase